jgi:hypothetical protein
VNVCGKETKPEATIGPVEFIDRVKHDEKGEPFMRRVLEMG